MVRSGPVGVHCSIYSIEEKPGWIKASHACMIHCLLHAYIMQEITEWLFWTHAHKQVQSPWPHSDMARGLQSVSSRSALQTVEEVVKGVTITHDQVGTFRPFIIILNQNPFQNIHYNAGHRKNSERGFPVAPFLTSF